MAKQQRKVVRSRDRQRRISVRAVRREQPDVRKLSRALLQYAVEQAAAEAAAQADHERRAAEAREHDGD